MSNSLSYGLGLEDFAAFSVFAVMRRNRGRASFGGPVPILGVFLGLTGLLAAWNMAAGMGLAEAVLSPAVILLPVAVLAILFARPAYRRQVRGVLARMVAEEREELLGPKTLCWDDAGLTQQGAHGHWHLSWRAVTAVEETPGHLFLMAGGLNGLFIPKRDQPPEEWARFLGAVSAATGLQPVAARL